jgi:FtsP/CotA-like multicopper oxidase with cupredoxin domain
MAPLPEGGFGRRSFLGVGGATLLCSLAGRTVEIRDPEDVRRVDALAAKTEKPASARAPFDEATFRTPDPQPGGQKREYWIAARTVTWNVAPKREDEWMKEPFTGKRTFRAYVYQLYSTGFAEPLGPARMPGPTLFGEVGDTIVVHFRNAGETLGQAVTMHAHGVRYNPEYDGSYLGDFTRAGGFIAPGEEFTYTWECTEDAVGV